ncbi:MAG: VCBS repeat-containing protein [Saprospiraceae bacterium]|nr:VCBS repeat-containing protein [Saprospiraceae bacterium]
MKYQCIIYFLALFIFSCQNKNSKTLFQNISHNKSGITFKNTLRETPEFNVMNYSYFYNGGGVATGDVNNDGLCDIYFTGNLVASHLYLNEGNWKFENIAEQAGVEAAGLWNTGVTMADVNADGWLDIYICRSAAKDPNGRRNLLFINQTKNPGEPVTFKEEAKEYGVDDPAYSTQASFFDYDRDGDLDMFLLNHSVPEFANFDNNIGQLKNRYNGNYGDKLYRNDNGKFTDVSRESGIISNVLGFGLGVAVSDYNGDHWPDIYVSNDFNEEDYLYINQQDGTFKEQLEEYLDYSSLFSMGSDAADINNDGMTDIVTLDMLPQDNYRIKLTSGADNFNKYQLLLKQGFYNQNMRNMLQLNNGDGFSEVGQIAGISNSDWSWSALVADYNLDGFQDLFVTNGYLRDYTNMDFLSFAVDLKLKEGPQSNVNDHIEELLQQMPKIDVPNKMYMNEKGFVFRDSSTAWGFTKIELSNGASYADLDNDGDLDLVVNNVNDFAGLYRNTAREKELGNFLKVDLEYPGGATGAIGSHLALYARSQSMHRDLFLSRGFQSSVAPSINFGLGSLQKIDSLVIYWPDGEKEIFPEVSINTTFVAKKGAGKNQFNRGKMNNSDAIFSPDNLISIRHDENDFNDFTVQRLLPKYYSRSGPVILTEDLNGDRREDIIFAGAQGQPTQVFVQNADGQFIANAQPALEKDAAFEDVDLVLSDLNGDARPDLLIASGGNAYQDGDTHYALRCYLNSGNGKFVRAADFPVLTSNAQCLAIGDLNQDDLPDIFLGSAYKAQEFPLPGENYVLLNEGEGNFTLTGDLPFVNAHVMDAEIIDYDNDGQNELVIAGEFEPLSIYSFKNGGWQLEKQSKEKGWYNTLVAVNLDADEELEFVVGNLGMNSQWIATKEKPIVNYYGDFDNNQTIDPILSCYIGEGSYPLVSRDDLIGQIPSLKKFFTSYKDYARTDMSELLTNLPNPATDTINDLQSIIFDVVGGSLEAVPLPVDAQVAPIYAIHPLDYDQDGDMDLLVAGNNEYNRVKLGEMNANHGLLVENTGNLKFNAVSSRKSGLNLRGDVRSIRKLQVGETSYYIFGINNREASFYRLDQNKIIQ